MPGGAAAAAPSSGSALSSFGVASVSQTGHAAIASQTAGFGPLISSTGSAASTASQGFNSLQFLQMVQALGTAATSYSQAQAQKAAGNFNASIYESNARIQAIMADDAIRRGEVEAKKAKQAAARLIGSQRATMGAQGIDLESGSALDIQEETASLGAEDALNIKNNAWREAWGFKVQESNYYSQSAYSRITANAKSRNTILTGGLSVAKNFAYASYLNKNKGQLTLEDYLTGV